MFERSQGDSDGSRVAGYTVHGTFILFDCAKPIHPKEVALHFLDVVRVMPHPDFSIMKQGQSLKMSNTCRPGTVFHATNILCQVI